MNVPDILGVEVITPDGRGSILSLHHGKVHVQLNRIELNQVMIGHQRENFSCHYLSLFHLDLILISLSNNPFFR